MHQIRKGWTLDIGTLTAVPMIVLRKSSHHYFDDVFHLAERSFELFSSAGFHLPLQPENELLLV